MNEQIAVIGAGPAGLTAALYIARAGINAKIFEKYAPGGQMLLTDVIENYPGFPGGIKAQELASHFLKQVEDLRVEFIGEEIASLAAEEKKFAINAASGKRHDFSAVVIAAGTSAKRLGIEGEEKLIGKGVSFCAVCDGAFFKNKEVAVIGGGNSAIEEATYLANIVKKVHVIHRRNKLRADHAVVEKLKEKNNVVFHLERRPLKINGGAKVESVSLIKPDQAQEIVPVDGVFIFAGWTPNSAFLKGFVTLDENGFVVTDDAMRTSREGVFACGDIRAKHLRQVVTACGEGATAGMQAVEYINKLRGTSY
jgi:thioredoxin reductase (NADPH)